MLRGGPKDESRYAKTGSFITTPKGSRKRVKKQPSPTMGKPSPKRPALAKEKEGPKCERHARMKENSLKKSIDGWQKSNNGSLKGSVIS